MKLADEFGLARGIAVAGAVGATCALLAAAAPKDASRDDAKGRAREHDQDRDRDRDEGDREEGDREEGDREDDGNRRDGVAVHGVHPPVHDLRAIDAVPAACWAEIRSQHIYFAHGPSGTELLKGLESILEERPSIAWRIVPYGTTGEPVVDATKDAPPVKEPAKEGVLPTSTVFATPAIVEGPAGADGDPKAKIDRFVSRLRSKEGAQVGVAALLLSAQDIVRGTDVEALARHYIDAMKSLTGARPTLRVLHCTVPLDFPDSGMRAKLRKFAGRGHDHANALRGRFNDLLRAEYGREQVIDIAHALSARADGTHCTVRVEAVQWPAMATEHADDEGNLNTQGRAAIAREFALALVRPCEAAAAPKESEVTVVPGSGGSD
jgi:hypothetical protein